MLDVLPRKKYVPDLNGLHDDCEMNYRRLREIMPAFEAGQHYVLRLSGEDNDSEVRTLFRVLSSSRYTAEVEIVQLSAISDWCDSPAMRVRVYHDTRMVEVIGYQGVSRFRASYSYPNARMCQPDEKSSVNRLLSDWLQLCLEIGLITAATPASSAL